MEINQNQLSVTQDWERDGVLIIEGASTIERYIELEMKQYNYSNPEIFIAFTKEDLEDKAEQRGLDLQEVFHFRYGICGTEKGYKQYLDDMKAIRKSIAAECNPQEVYYYEWNNHECHINLEGDLEPANIIRRIWGKETLAKINRINKYEQAV